MKLLPFLNTIPGGVVKEKLTRVERADIRIDTDPDADERAVIYMQLPWGRLDITSFFKIEGTIISPMKGVFMFRKSVEIVSIVAEKRNDRSAME